MSLASARQGQIGLGMLGLERKDTDQLEKITFDEDVWEA